MELLSSILEPHTETIGNVASIVTIANFLPGVILCNDIRKKGSTSGFSFIPFLGGFILTALITRFGMILDDLTTVRTNLVGVILNILYIVFFYTFTKNAKDKTYVWAQIGFGGAFIAGVFAYAQVEDQKLLVPRFGWIVTAVLFALVGSPFLSLGEIIRSKSTAGLPFPFIFCGTLVSVSWLLYGFAVRQNIVILQNAVTTAMSLAQLSLFVIYPSKAAPKKIKSKRPNNNNTQSKKNN